MVTPRRPFLLALFSSVLLLVGACARPATLTEPVVALQPTQTPHIVVVTQVVTQVVKEVVTATPDSQSTAAASTATAVVQAQVVAEQTAVVAQQTAAAAPTATTEPTVAPTLPAPTPTVQVVMGPDMGTVTHGGNLREAPGGAVLGQLCPGDVFTYLHSQGEWYTIRIESVATDCVPDRVKAGNIGWVHQSLLTPPQVAIPTTTPAPTPEVQAFNQTQTIGPIRQPLSDERYSTEITLLQVRWSKGSGFSAADSGKVYALATMRVKNLGPNGQRNVSTMMFKALDSRGALNDAEHYYGDDCEMEWVDLTAGGAIEGCIAFEVPEGGKLSLIYAPYLFENLTPGRYLSFTIRP